MNSPATALPPPAANLDCLLGPGNYSRIANLTGISRPHVGRLLKGQTKQTTYEVIERIALAVKLRVEDVAGYIKTRRELRNSTRYVSSKQLPDETIEEIRKRVVAGESCSDLAREYPVSRATINNHTRGLSPRAHLQRSANGAAIGTGKESLAPSK